MDYMIVRKVHGTPFSNLVSSIFVLGALQTSKYISRNPVCCMPDTKCYNFQPQYSSIYQS